MSSLGWGAWPRSSSMARRTAAIRPAGHISLHITMKRVVQSGCLPAQPSSAKARRFKQAGSEQ
eukprot:scaffold119894_cov25-Tisochrysis_lutea.AAC.1